MERASGEVATCKMNRSTHAVRNKFCIIFLLHIQFTRKHTTTTAAALHFNLCSICALQCVCSSLCNLFGENGALDTDTGSCKGKTTKQKSSTKDTTRRNEGREITYYYSDGWLFLGSGTGIILNLNQTTIFAYDAVPFVVVLASSLSSILFFCFVFFGFVLT